MDFGTSNTTVAFRDSQGAIRDVPLSSTGTLMPSAVVCSAGRMLTAGEAAVLAGHADPAAYDPTPKRRMDQIEVNIAGLYLPQTDLVAAVLSEALAKTAAFTGEPPGEVVLTYPNHWHETVIQRLATAGEVAGIDQHRMRLVDEASAAAAYHTAAQAERIAVVDIGAGTCGVSVLDRQQDGTFTVTAADGFDGLDFEARIKAWALQQLQATNPALAAEAADAADLSAQLRLADTTRIAKETLSAEQSAPLVVSGAAGSETLHLSRAQLEALIAADVDRAVRLTESLLFHANTIRQHDQPVPIHLTGGSSRIPLLQARFAGVGPVQVLDPKAVVAQGALQTTPTPEQQRYNKVPEPPPVPVRSRWKRRKQRRAAAKAALGGGATRRRKLITTTTRKWLAGIALIAIVASGVGVAAVMIFGSITAPDQPPQASTPRTTFAPPTPKVPTPLEFTVNVIVTEQQCPPEAPGCTYKYTIEPKYVGLHPLPETPFTVFYEVVGGNAPQKGEFTVHKDQAKILKDVVLEGPPAAQLRANVLQVAG
ncbi:Hsp70 family protein [Mycolicibacterium flavescens]|uniref:Hsp70 family protein n=1 Tax=Mycolicibacterium flavescens TaxID=1776 RepID=UPI000D6CA35C|nr:Hsp70 family protein [Mycolicibacterium flavescens]MCV7280943.1 Hsp70 family protein [Mycolicibacterium flavescens]